MQKSKKYSAKSNNYSAKSNKYSAKSNKYSTKSNKYIVQITSITTCLQTGYFNYARVRWTPIRKDDSYNLSNLLTLLLSGGGAS